MTCKHGLEEAIGSGLWLWFKAQLVACLNIQAIDTGLCSTSYDCSSFTLILYTLIPPRCASFSYVRWLAA